MGEETRVRDRYDQEVERLSANPDAIEPSWWHSHPSHDVTHSPLFDACGYSRSGGKSSQFCGCLTQVKCGMHCAQTSELTDAIRQDGRIPGHSLTIKAKDLPVFAEWQRRIDKELNRTPPPMLPEPTEAQYLASINSLAPEFEAPETRGKE